MSQVVIDIETVGIPFESYVPEVQSNLLKYCTSQEEEEKVKGTLALSAMTGQIVAIGMLNPASGRGHVHYQDKGNESQTLRHGLITYQSGTETQILQRFWASVKSYSTIVTFNGRSFDCPYISIRSAVNRVQPTRELLPYRYATKEHIDLLDQLTFYGATRKYSLDMYCRLFNIGSPKADGMDGSKVGEYFHAGKCIEIAKYCANDLMATAELLEVWENHVHYPPKKELGNQTYLPGTVLPPDQQGK